MCSEPVPERPVDGTPSSGAAGGVPVGRGLRTMCRECGEEPAMMEGPLCGGCRDERLEKVTYRVPTAKSLGMGGWIWRELMMGKKKYQRGATERLVDGVLHAGEVADLTADEEGD